MDDTIPDRATRHKQADVMGATMYGADVWEKLKQNITELDPTFATFIEEIPYGTIYPRSQLSLPMREVASIALLTQMNLKPQLKSHIIAAMRAGMREEQIRELFLHVSQYIGFPLVLDGLKVAKEVFDAKK